MVERLFIGYMPKITPVAGNYSDTFRKYSYSLLKKKAKKGHIFQDETLEQCN